MRRAKFTALVGGVAITWPHAAVGQQKSAGLPRFGVLTAYPEGDTAQPLKPNVFECRGSKMVTPCESFSVSLRPGEERQ